MFYFFQILFELSLRIQLELSKILERLDALIIELGSFLQIPEDANANSENRKLSILQKLYSNYKPKRIAKVVQPLFIVMDVNIVQ